MLDKKKHYSGVMSAQAKRLVELLGCPCEIFAEGSDPEVVLNAYNEAFAKRETGGYMPFVIVIDNVIRSDLDDCEITTTENLKRTRDKILASKPIDVDKWFLEKLAEHKADVGEYWNELVGEIEHDSDDFLKKFRGFINFWTKKTQECVLAKIPTEKPWEVLAWLPFLGGDECPSTEEIMWIAKHWYERFGAVPAVMESHVLEFSAAPVKDEKTAVELALQQFEFCFDLIAQCVGSVGKLAGALTEASVWYFWWD